MKSRFLRRKIVFIKMFSCFKLNLSCKSLYKPWRYPGTFIVPILFPTETEQSFISRIFRLSTFDPGRNSIFCLMNSEYYIIQTC